MNETTVNNLEGVAETLLIPLYIRSKEAQRPDALIKDNQAVALVKGLNYDFSGLKFDKDDETAIILRNREFDRYTCDFLRRHPQAVVVHIGCGLDARFERVDNGQVEWYDLDLPDVIALRRKLIGGEAARYHFLECSVFDPTWLEAVSVHRPRPFLFLAEGVLVYFEESQVKSLILTLRENFPGSELVFDAFSGLIVWANNRRMERTRLSARYHWGLSRGKDLESWGEGIHLQDEWRYLDKDEPRLAHLRWVRYIPPLAKSSGIFHFRLGHLA